MLLVVDIGNTNIHIGVWDGHSWGRTWRMRTVRDKMADEYAVLLRNFLGAFDRIDQVAISSVVPALNSTFTEVSHNYLEVDPLIVSSQITLGIALNVDQPEQVGADRIVNAVAAQAISRRPTGSAN